MMVQGRKVQAMARLVDWGFSMYGGYYANYFNDNEELVYISAGKLSELRAALKEVGLKADNDHRFDNI
jgi:hypothetical protein